MGWPPKIGEVLPRATECWHEQIKLDDWVLGERGHGSEWERVFRVGLEDREKVWEAIASAVAETNVTGVRELGQYGLNCEADVRFAIGDRSATVRTIWHYATPDSAPRLVSAYPKL